jgi:O-antigen/teichoic acid export membrane protein
MISESAPQNLPAHKLREGMTSSYPSGAFRPVAEGSELRHLAVRGAGVSVFSKGATLSIQLVSAVVLARLLVPADFGVVAMVTTFSLLLQSVGVNGFTEAIIQRDEIDHFTASNLFWINVGLGLVLTILFAEAGSLLARFYRDPLVSRVAVGISPTILLANTSHVHLALLKRAMRFGAVSANDVAARALSVTVSMLLAWAGWGFWALVAGTVAQPLSMTIGAWTMCRWVPSLPRRTTATGSVIRFASPVYARFALRYFLRNMDNVLVGWRFSAEALGFYKKAYDLFALSADQLISPLADVALATLSRLRREPVRFSRYLVNSLAIVSFVGMGVGADLTLVGKDVVRLVLGPKWGESGSIFALFGPGIGIMLLHSTCGWIHLSIGRPDRWLRWSVVELVVTWGLFLVALPWGPAGIAVAWSASFWLLTVPAFWYAGRPVQFGISSLFAAAWKYVVASLLAGGICTAFARGFLSSPTASAAVALERMVVISGLFAGLYLGAVILLHWGCAPIRQLANLLREFAPKRTSAKPAPAGATI